MEEKKDEINQEVDEKEMTNNSENNEKKSEESKTESSEADTPQAYPEKSSMKISTEGKKNEFVEKARENPWIVSSVILGILLLGFLFSGSGVTGGVITGGAVASGDIISVKVADAELIEVYDKGNFYEIVLLIEGKELSLYVTKDGESFTQSLIPLVENKNGKLNFIPEDNLEDSLVN